MRRRRVGVVCGGSGSSKFVIALDKYFEKKTDLGFVCNVADNFWFHQLYVCPDVDIMTYALANKLDKRAGWGIQDDTTSFLKGFEALGFKSWFKLGDEDLAMSVLRTELMKKGFTLSQITKQIGKSLRIRHSIIPSTDDDVQTYIDTRQGTIHLQEFWVKLKGTPKVYGVEYKGLKKASPSKDALKFLSKNVVILPANPITSILPTISLRGVRGILKRAKVIAISPFVGKTIFSGPGAKLMRALKVEPSSFGVAKLYSDFLRIFLVDKDEEASEIKKIKGLGIECLKTNIRVIDATDERSVATEIMRAL